MISEQVLITLLCRSMWSQLFTVNYHSPRIHLTSEPQALHALRSMAVDRASKTIREWSKFTSYSSSLNKEIVVTVFVGKKAYHVHLFLNYYCQIYQAFINSYAKFGSRMWFITKQMWNNTVSSLNTLFYTYQTIWVRKLDKANRFRKDCLCHIKWVREFSQKYSLEPQKGGKLWIVLANDYV